LSDKLDWEAQVDNITKKASNTLNFLKCNLEYCPKHCKQVAYFALVRSTVEYGSVVWDPHTSKEKDKVRRVNKRAARMLSNDYGRHSSVTSMLTRLGWATLEQRHENQRLTMMYKVVHGMVAVPTTHLTAADSRTRANHSFKFRTISCNSTPYKYSLFSRTILLGTSYQQKPPKLRPLMHSSIVFRIVPPFISIGVISLHQRAYSPRSKTTAVDVKDHGFDSFRGKYSFALV